MVDSLNLLLEFELKLQVRYDIDWLQLCRIGLERSRLYSVKVTVFSSDE